MAEDKGEPELRPTPHILGQTAAMQAMVNSPANRAVLVLGDIAALIVRDHRNQRIVKLLDPRNPTSGLDLEEFRLKKLTPIAEKQWGEGLSPKTRLDDLTTASLYFLMDSRPFAPEHRDYLQEREPQLAGAKTHYRELFHQLCDVLEGSLPNMKQQQIIPEVGGFHARFYESDTDPMSTSAYITVPRQCRAALEYVGKALYSAEYATMQDAEGKPITSKSGSLIR